ncbi:MAG: hypothetical protein MUF71_17335 [Candidatus Kapabacteria bacterium]|jgi:hypothetical protein|nr:hypothetical protein [Candidatus Kapabacteria bacterium]
MTLLAEAFRIVVILCLTVIPALTISQQNLVCMPTGSDTVRLADGTRIICEVPDKSLSVGENVLKEWIRLNACAVRTYFGVFPVPLLRLVIKPVQGSNDISYGNAMPGSPPLITVYVGTEANEEEYRQSWVLAHEMTHLAFPTLDRTYRWIEEGMATYVEPIARVMAGIITEESVWEEMTRKAPTAFVLDRRAHKGLNGARDFERVYWGGAVFCLMADIEIRQKTHNKHSFQSTLQAILRQEGTMNTDRDVLRVMRRGDKVIGVRVLEPLYKQFGTTSFTPNLPKLWADLGVVRRGNTIELRNDAPLAALRRNIFSCTCPVCIHPTSKP